MPICPSCRREVAAGKFCPECGAALPPPADAPTMERETVPAAPDSRPSSSSSSSSSLHGRFEPGTRLGTRYRVVGLLGRGGMGEVYRADDLELNQSVALKFLPERVARNAADLARLRAEVRTARQIAHPNVCRTYDIAEADGQVFLVMEYVDGEDLASVLRRLGRPSPDKAIEIARQLCLGLGAAHENGVLHRDLKPANIMIDGRGRVRITDFGLAGTAEEIAAEGGVSGTPAYMAPEQRRAGGGSIQSDIFSLGLVLYEIFTGKRVSDMTPRPDPSRRAASGDSSVITPSSLVADIDPAVERVILRCLEHDPARRPQSAYAVFGALPGGDPLAAAVAAGETPSPELVANAGVEGSVRPLFAGIAVAVVIAGFLIVSMLVRPLLGGLDRSAQFLSVRADQILTRVTGSEPPPYSAQGFVYATLVPDSASESDSLSVRGAAAAKRPPRAKFYWKRWSPAVMTPTSVHQPRTDLNDPPQVFPGSATVILTSSGRLMALSAVSELSGDSARTRGVDWSSIVTAAGHDIATLASSAVPDSFVAQADTMAAWRVSALGDPDTTLAVAALGGRLVQAGTYAGKRSVLDLSIQVPRRSASSIRNWLAATLFAFLPVLGGIFLARRNLKSGRGDVRGALVIGVSVVVLYVVEYLFSVRVTELGLYRILIEVFWGAPAGHALIHGAAMTVAYLALEPYIRRLWPSVLVTWARLVAGRWKDPIVGRDALIGAIAGLGLGGLLFLGVYLSARWRLSDRPLEVPAMVFAQMLSPQGVLAAVADNAVTAFLYTTVQYTILVALRFVLRRNTLAVGGLILIMTLVSTDFGQRGWWLTSAVALVAMSGLMIVMLRFGFVAALATWFTIGMLSSVPWTTDFGVWFAPQVMLSWVVILAMLGYGFATAVGGRSLLSDPLSDPVIGGGRPTG